ncbi:MAG: hypothetical protein WC254_03475 [Candidatus Woesearchaeota archaeon]|jgi:hypothetical protein
MVITGTNIVDFWSNLVFPRFWQMIDTPQVEPEILWTILPLLVTAFFVELYFGRNKIEELGWNTAFANCISLLWVTSALIRFMYESYGSVIFQLSWSAIAPTMILFILLGLWSLVLSICNFFHILPKSISFFASSTIPVNVTAVLAVVIVIGKFPLDRITAIASIMLFVALAIIFATIQALARPSPEAKKYIEEYKKQAEEKKKEHKQEVLHFIDMTKGRIIAHWISTKQKIMHMFKHSDPVVEPSLKQ